jgi:peroxiredoxin Q/BCP
MSELKLGDPAPAFQLTKEDGTAISNKTLAGRPAVLFFYPQDDSPTCTDEAIAFSALAPEFADLGVALLGVSPDSVKSHAKFRVKRGLSVELASDEMHGAINVFGLWGEKTTFGRSYMGVERATFLLDKDGVLRGIWRKVRIKNHAREVLEAAARVAKKQQR